MQQKDNRWTARKRSYEITQTLQRVHVFIESSQLKAFYFVQNKTSRIEIFLNLQVQVLVREARIYGKTKKLAGVIHAL